MYELKSIGSKCFQIDIELIPKKGKTEQVDKICWNLDKALYQQNIIGRIRNGTVFFINHYGADKRANAVLDTDNMDSEKIAEIIENYFFIKDSYENKDIAIAQLANRLNDALTNVQVTQTYSLGTKRVLDVVQRYMLESDCSTQIASYFAAIKTDEPDSYTRVIISDKHLTEEQIITLLKGGENNEINTKVNSRQDFNLSA